MTTFTHPDNAPEGHKWQTRDGRDVRIVCTDAKGNWPIVALVYDGASEKASSYTRRGNYSLNTVTAHDLIDAPKPKRVIEGWVNVYVDRGGNPWFGNIHDTKSDADDAGEDRIACIHIRAEEGEGL
jgi:hypothetical protein